MSAKPDLTAHILIILLAAAFAAATFERNAIWHDNIRLWSDILRQNDHSFKAHYGLGDGYYDQGDFSEAAYHYEQAVLLNPNAPDIHFNLGLAYINGKRYRQAVRELLLVAGNESLSAEAHYNLGLAYEREGLRDMARKEYQAALRLEPGFTQAMIALADASRRQDRPASARQ